MTEKRDFDNFWLQVEVTESEVDNSVNSIPKLDTLILVKSMIKNHSFQVPVFKNCFFPSSPVL